LRNNRAQRTFFLDEKWRQSGEAMTGRRLVTAALEHSTTSTNEKFSANLRDFSYKMIERGLLILRDG
jgi:hypothetical protein